MPIEPNEKMAADVSSLSPLSKVYKNIEIESLNLSGLNFRTKSFFSIGEEVEIKIYTKRFV
jgi:hypothetical protein